MAASKGLSFDPSISCHLTETSPSGICSISATFKFYFSQVEIISLCRTLNCCKHDIHLEHLHIKSPSLNMKSVEKDLCSSSLQQLKDFELDPIFNGEKELDW